MEEKKLVPKLRFPGFTEPWEQRKLGEVVKSYSGGTPTASNKEYYGGDIPFIRSAEINSDTTELYITQKGLDNSSAKIVKKGTILYAMYGATSGEVGISKINGAINQAILAMTPLDYDSKIIAQYLRKNKESIIGKYLQGGQGNLSANIILELPIQLPGLEESNQIVYFLESVDNLITLHQRKLEHLKLKKKSLLQKLFPKEGEVYPELRFPGFTDPWEQRKLSEITTCFDNLRVPVTASDRVSGKTPYYGANGIQDYVSGNTHSGEFVLIAEDGANDLNDYPVQYVNGEIWVNNHAHVIAGFKEKLDNKFLSYALKTVKMTTFIVGSGRSKLNLKALLEIPISMPNYNEQCFVGRFIDKIDTNITLHQRKLEHLQLLKKALLQQLFV